MTLNQHSICAFLSQNLEKNPAKKAIINNGRTLSYEQFCEKVSDYTKIMYHHGVKQGTLIGVCLKDSIEFSALMFACANLGAAIAPIDNTTPSELARARFEDLNVNFTISDLDLKDPIDLSESVPEEDITLPELSGEETMIISLTSGSTSEPKAIELSQNIKIRRANAHIDLYDISEDDIILSSTPLYHSLAERLVIMSLIKGATAVIMDEFKPYEWFSLVDKEKVSFTICDSSQLAQISQILLSPFVPEIRSLRTIVSSSSFLENHVKKELINRLDCGLYEIYGTSETSTLTNINLKENDRIRSVGTPLKGVELKIADPDEKGIGEILCKSSLIFKGYYHNEKLSESTFTDGWFMTGDLGRIDEEGYLYYCGRKSEMIKVNGINIYPFDIEDTLSRLEGIEEAAIFNYPDDIKGNVIGLAAVLKEDASISVPEIEEFCRQNLPALSRPEYIFILKQLPKNSMGKIRKNKIYENIIRSQMMGE